MVADVALLAVALAVTLIGIAIYLRIANKFGIVAVPNERTLHAGIKVRGGGIVIATVFLAGLAVLHARGTLPATWFLALFAGGLAIAVLGFVDDIVHLSMRVRLLVQLAVATFAVVVVRDDLGLGPVAYP